MYSIKSSKRKLIVFALVAIFIIIAFGQHVRRKYILSGLERQLIAEGILPLPDNITILCPYPKARPCNLEEKIRERFSLGLQKNQKIVLLSTDNYTLSALPRRGEQGQYSLALYMLDWGKRNEYPNGSLYFPTENTPTVFHINDQGSFVQATNDWACMLAFERDAEGLVAWRNPQTCTNALPHPQGYRRFYMKGRKGSSGLSLVHERFK